MLLQVEGLNTYYGEAVHALRDVSFEVAEGEIISIIGANGAGKSTLMWTLIGQIKPRSGKITFNGKVMKPVAHTVVAAGMALVPERRRLFPNLTVRENLSMGSYLRSDRAAIQKDMEYIFTLFPILKKRLSQFAGTLSGGEQQMVATARGLMSRPKLLLLDEPSLGLAPILVNQIFYDDPGNLQAGNHHFAGGTERQESTGHCQPGVCPGSRAYRALRHRPGTAE